MKLGVWKRIATMAMCLLMLVMILPVKPAEAASSTTPAKVTEAVVVERIKKLQAAFSGKYFTTTQSSCGNSKCGKCNAPNVVKKDWVKEAIDLVPKSFSMKHYYYGGSLPNGWSCCGFANYAGWYIFAQKSNHKVKFKQQATGEFNYTTMSKAKPGDIIRLGNKAKKGSSTHSAIVVDVTPTGVKVFDCNFQHYNYVYTHTIGYTQYSKYKYVTISRATNYDTSAPVTVNVTFDANGGSLSTTSQKVTYGQTYGTLPTPTRTGYDFAGWYDAVNGGNQITSTTKVTKTSNHTLYAHWVLHKYNLFFNANGGTCSTASKQVAFGSAYGALPVPVRSGYNFIGWFTSASGGTQVTAATKLTVAQDQTVYAHWQFNSNPQATISVTFNANGGSVSQTSIKVILGATYGTLPTPTRTGYDFTGWYDAPNGGNLITSSTVVSNGANHTLYAHWTIHQYTLTFNANGGVCVTKSQKVAYGSAYGKLPTPTRDGYSFQGWFTAASGGTQVTEDTKLTVAKDQTVYAQWKWALKYRYDSKLAMSKASSLLTTAKKKGHKCATYVSSVLRAGGLTNVSQSGAGDLIDYLNKGSNFGASIGKVIVNPKGSQLHEGDVLCVVCTKGGNGDCSNGHGKGAGKYYGLHVLIVSQVLSDTKVRYYAANSYVFGNKDLNLTSYKVKCSKCGNNKSAKLIAFVFNDAVKNGY